ncbi:MAG: signal recognition particle-docking protein FtsY [Cyanobacteria bacterium SIG30]|nr:signal recognition particle-docking protein FtsY [Cyanobacteria bacterium SIG30]
MFNFFKKKDDDLKNIVAKTSEALVKNVLSFVNLSSDKIDDLTLEDIETTLIKADLGVEFTTDIIEKIEKEKVKPNELESFLKKEFSQILNDAGSNELIYEKDRLNIYFVVGINGAGKTTLIGKLANKMRLEGNKVLIAAGDTFRAAAEEQLDVWAQRAQVDIVRKDKIDSAAVVYEAIEKAKNENYNVLLVDTAGRLQNKFNLIEELKKIKAVTDKKAPDCVSETILVLDANLGQNGISQAKVFLESVGVSCAAMTKLDGTARGGIILAIAKNFKIPTKLIGVGEKIEDIKEFNSKDFIEALFNK